MPALLATCVCGYKFAFDYDFRQVRCSKCSLPFDWKANPHWTGSSRGSLDEQGTAEVSGRTGYRRPDSTPRLPGEAGYEEYARGAKSDREASIDLGRRTQDD